jgi:hypothetical protein
VAVRTAVRTVVRNGDEQQVFGRGDAVGETTDALQHVRSSGVSWRSCWS